MTCTFDNVVTWCHVKKFKTYFHFHKTHKPQTCQTGDLGWGDPMYKISKDVCLFNYLNSRLGKEKEIDTFSKWFKRKLWTLSALNRGAQKLECLIRRCSNNIDRIRCKTNICFKSFNIAHIIYYILLILLVYSGDTQLNPAPNKKTVILCHWNLDSITAQIFSKIFLLEAYNDHKKFDRIYLSETHFDFSTTYRR